MPWFDSGIFSPQMLHQSSQSSSPILVESIRAVGTRTYTYSTNQIMCKIDCVYNVTDYLDITPFFSTKYLNKKKKKGQSELRCIKERKLVLFASQFSWEAKRNGNKSKHKNIFTKKLTTWTRSSVHLFSRPALLEPVIFALAQDPWNNQSRPDGAHISVPALSIKNASTFPLDVWKKKESYHIKPPNPQNRIVPCPSLTLRAIISLHSLTLMISWSSVSDIFFPV